MNSRVRARVQRTALALTHFRPPLERWQLTAEALGVARRKKLASERRLDLALAQLERQLVLHLYKDTFGHRIGYPKLPRPRIATR